MENFRKFDLTTFIINRHDEFGIWLRRFLDRRNFDADHTTPLVEESPCQENQKTYIDGMRRFPFAI
jgi:hypothetical protein